MALTPEDLRSRLRFDFEICHNMFGRVFAGEAYRSTSDMERRTNPVAAAAEGHLATKYRVDFFVPTLVGPGKLQEITTIGFDLATGNYPFSEPATWVISERVPYSPHFRKGAPVCIGPIWKEGRGQLLLGQLMVHIAKLLNWDEVARGGGYVGWNGEAIKDHATHYGGRPISPGLRYPALPSGLTHGLDADQPLFFAGTPGRADPAMFATTDTGSMFAPSAARRIV